LLPLNKHIAIMKKILLLIFLVLASFSAEAQSVGKKSDVIAAEKAQEKIYMASSDFMYKAGVDFMVSGGTMLGCVGLGIGAQYVHTKSAHDIMLVGSGILGLVSVIRLIDGGIKLNKAGKLLRKERQQYEQAVAIIEPSQSGLGIKVTF